MHSSSWKAENRTIATDVAAKHQLSVDLRPVCCRILPASAETVPASALRFPVLLLHGLGCSADAWGPTLAQMERRGISQPVFAPDLPGYGDSDGPRHALSIIEMADWAERLLDNLAVPHAHIAGNSMGCQVALELARRHPSRIGGVVLVGPVTGRRHVPYVRYAAGLLLDAFSEPLRYNITLLRMGFEMGIIRYLGTVRRMMENEPLSYAGEIAAPCLILRGSRDRIVPLDVPQQLADLMPRGRFVLVNEASHALQFGKPKEFVDLALPFWRQAEEEMAGL